MRGEREVPHRDAKADKFYLNRDDPLSKYLSETPAFLRFARAKEYGLDPWHAAAKTRFLF